MSDESSDNYSFVSKLIHWITALIILSLLVVGFYMGDIESNGLKYQIYNLHKSFGLAVLALVFVRVVWHLINKKPKSLETHQKWEVAVSHATHAFLYFLMIAVPFSGWVMASASGYGVKFFGFNVPDIVSKSESLHELAEELHELFAWAIIVVIGLHIAGALKHYFIDKDRTLERMTWRNIGIIPVALIILFTGATYTLIALQEVFEESIEGHEKDDHDGGKEEHSSLDSASETQFSKVINSDITEWIIDKEKSVLSFEAKQYGQSFNGYFDFDGQIFFDPEKLDQSKVMIFIDINSIKTGSLDRDQQAKSKDWFDAISYPKAMFESSNFLKGSSEGSYLAKGDLTLRGVKLPVDLPFNLEIKEKDHENIAANMSANINLSRFDFGVGQGQWNNEDAIGDNVSVSVNLLANKN